MGQFFDAMRARKQEIEGQYFNVDTLDAQCTHDARADDNDCFLSDTLDHMSIHEFDIECITLHA